MGISTDSIKVLEVFPSNRNCVLGRSRRLLVPKPVKSAEGHPKKNRKYIEVKER
jgi:hypothetical protein